MEKTVSTIMLTLLLSSMLTLAFNIQPVKAEGTIYIRADGSIDPQDAPISRNGDAYDLTGSITSNGDGIVIERSNMTLNGTSHLLLGAGSGIGIYIAQKSNVTVKKMNIKGFKYGIFLNDSLGNIIQENVLTSNEHGVELLNSSANKILANTMSNNTYGVNIDFNSSEMGGAFAAIVDQLEESFPNPDFNVTGVVSNILESVGYVPSYYKSETVDVEFFKNLAQYNYKMIVFRGHSVERAYDHNVDFVTSEEFNESKYPFELDRGWLIKVDLPWENKSYFGITPEFIQNIKGNFPKSIIVAMGCSAVKNVSMAEAFNAKGAKVFIGWNDMVDVSHADNETIKLLEKLLWNNSTFDVAVSAVSPDPFFGAKMDYIPSDVANLTAFDLNRILDNAVISNNFVENSVQASTHYAINLWNGSYSIAGNYWSDYNGTDSDFDGIGDTSYVIDANNQDYYPLMGMFSSFKSSLGYGVDAVSNSTIEDFEYSESNNTVTLHVSNMTVNQTNGFCRLTIPHGLLSPPYTITINGTQVSYTPIFENETLSIIYFSYQHSTLEIIIIPEFPSILILPLFMLATLLAVMVYRRKHRVKPVSV
jgi:parallel beta-helix repeat protein